MDFMELRNVMSPFFKKNKFYAKRSKCNLGHSHPSMLEGQYCNQLQMLLKAKEIQGFEYAKKYELRVNGNLICNHFPDFTVRDKNGVLSVHETKGMESDLWRIKRKLFESLYNIEYIVIK